MKNCIYRFIGKNREILYIGKANNLKHRLNGHTHLPDECYKRTKKIEYYSFKTYGDMNLAERYYISKHEPVYNDLLKEEISIDIKEFDNIEFITYVGRKKTNKQKSKGKIRNIELLVKNNSFDSYTSKSNKRWYRVPYSFIQTRIEPLSERGIYTEYEGCESITKFGEEYEKPIWLIYSDEDDYSFYIYCEEYIDLN